MSIGIQEFNEKFNEKRRLDFMSEVEDEMERAVALHGDFHSVHEAYGVLLEEVDEFWEHVRKRKENRNLAEVRKELIQIAAMCWKTARFLGIETAPADGGVNQEHSP